MGKLFANLGGAAVLCLGTHAITGGGWKALGLGILSCVIANVAGLSQTPPAVLGGKAGS